ncbi:MAG: NAD(P)-dependent oxidoreductase [Clostridium sp.]|nr:NAD(P)-dependent oxidoreductase [Prevotella sp.]MCM1429689.1 NAD(P)-dependent oxidoreductase [Clostridium sp.]MCM1476156.1 NAD(P)-dependent oxidoreductase [Muribaculaceae bacterium]
MENPNELHNQTHNGDASSPKRVLIVGAGGFAGGHIVDEALARGLEVTAGVRSSTSRKYLTDPSLKFLEFDFETPESISATLRRAVEEGIGPWDWIVYNLGATKCLSFLDFNRINYIYLQNFTRALEESGTIPERMLYMSSLSAMGKGDEQRYSPFTEEMIPMPDTRYGASKLKAEMWLATCPVPTIIFRCTGLYGPRDRDYFLMFDSIAKGFDFSVGFRRQELSFLYITDLSRAVFDALERGRTSETYNVAEERTYMQKEFRKMAAKALHKKFVLPMRMPLFLVKIVCLIAEKVGVARGKPATLNTDKYKILAQRNWAVDTSKAQRDFGFKTQVDLREGIRRSVEWYRKEGWLK